MTQGRIAVIGAGAIGLLFAARLARVTDSPVTLVSRRAALREALRHGIHVIHPDGSKTHATRIELRVAGEDDIGEHDVILVAVSAYDTRAAAAVAADMLSPQGICITLQNGLDNQARLAEVLGEQRAIQGATSFAVHLPREDTVQMASDGACWLPALPPAFDWLHGLLEDAGLKPIRIADAQQLAWHKTALGVNGYLCVILERPLGQVVRIAPARELVYRAALEVVDVAAACGVTLDRAGLRAAMEKSWAACDPHSMASMYSDYVAGKKTEIEERLGGVLQRARRHGVAVPTLEAIYLMFQARLELAQKPA